MDPRVPLDGTLLAIPVPLPQAGPAAYAPVPTPLPAHFPMPLPLGFLLNNCSPFKNELKRAPF